MPATLSLRQDVSGRKFASSGTLERSRLASQRGRATRMTDRDRRFRCGGCEPILRPSPARAPARSRIHGQAHRQPSVRATVVRPASARRFFGRGQFRAAPARVDSRGLRGRSRLRGRSARCARRCLAGGSRAPGASGSACSAPPAGQGEGRAATPGLGAVAGKAVAGRGLAGMERARSSESAGSGQCKSGVLN